MAVLKILVSAALLGTVARCQNIYSAYSPGGGGGASSSGIGQYSPTVYSRGTPRLVPVKQSGNHVQYHTAATTAPVVLKRGRVLAAPSPYSLEAASAASSSSGGLQYTQNIPQYRPAPSHQQQISASPVHHQQQHHAQLQAQQQYQQPAYYIQKGPVVVGPGRPVKIAKAKKPLPLPTADTEEEEYPSDPNPQYNFSFDIKDDELTNYQNRQEERDGQTIKGSYSVVDPDGYVRTVTYTADSKNGFQAKVTREPTDVKIKFPVPTQAPEATQQAGQRRGQTQAYQPQYQGQYQPQYQQQAQYATPQQVYASSVQPEVQEQPRYVARTASRFAIQPQGSSPRARIVRRRARRPSPSTPTVQQEADQE